MMTRVSEGFVKSNAKMRKVAKSRETKNRLAVAGLKKEHSLALDKIKKMETTLRSKEEIDRNEKTMEEMEGKISEVRVVQLRSINAHFLQCDFS